MPPAVPAYLPQVILKFRDSVTLSYEDDNGNEIERKGYGPWATLESRFPGLRIKKLYRRVSAADVQSLVDRAVARVARHRSRNLLTYFVVDCPSHVDSRDVAKELSGWPSVEAAFVDGVPRASSGCTTAFQGAAAVGVDAQAAWTVPGGDGQGQEVVDVEQGWVLDHVALAAHGIPPPADANDPASASHGTSVLGIICGQSAVFTGIAPNVQTVRVQSALPNGAAFASMADLADAITAAAAQLAFGGVLIIELQSPDFLPCESMAVCFDPISIATSAGVVVIEVAGNAGRDLDGVGNPAFSRGPKNNPNPGFQDSGAILVASATGNAPHQWRASSNFGTRIDCYACGDGVLAPVSNGPGDTMSTGCFFDTSAATAIIAGVALSVQGMTQAQTGQRADPSALRSILSDPATGTGATGPNAGMIGVMPDLNAIALKIQQASPVAPAPSAPTNLRIGV